MVIPLKKLLVSARRYPFLCAVVLRNPEIIQYKIFIPAIFAILSYFLIKVPFSNI
ncbi:unnamed protein product [Cuscuta europaea]|uniref:Uncharacterized protein n=1 Tax=Cuscuta europaea TaxID=41803 RepID=A0A9P1EBY6_CUSEU|nr:unnamed protein product [Cuscuta europaea]